MGALFYHDVKMLIKGSGAFLFLLALLCLAGALWRGANEEGEGAKAERIHIGVVNHDTSAYSQMLVSFYQENPVFTSYVSIYLGEEEEVHNLFQAGGLDMYLVIPEDFADSMVYLDHRPVEAVISTRNAVTQVLLENLMQGYKNYISAVEINCVALYDVMLASGMTKQDAGRVNERISVQLVLQALDKDSFFERHTVPDYTAIGLVPYYLHELLFLVLAYFALMAGVRFQKEHHAGILRRLVSMGDGMFGILFEKQAVYSIFLSTVLLLIWGILKYFGVLVDFALVCFVWITGCLMCAGMLFLAALFQKLSNYLLASNLYLLLGAVFGGGMIPFMYLPGRMLFLAKATPGFWFLNIMFRMEGGKMPGYAGAFVAGSIGAMALFLIMAALVYRGKEGLVLADI